MFKRYLIPAALILMFLLAACSGGQTTEISQAEAVAMPDTADESQDGAMMEESQDDEMDMDSEDHEDDEVMMEESEDDEMAGAMLPAWQTIALTDAATGEAFTLGDFQGKTVFVEPMATWCSNCRAQQGHVREAKAQLGEAVVFIGLSLETNLPPEQLASYAQSNGFDWTYAVMPVELLGALTDEFGRSITSAPSTPHFIIRPDGSFSELATGIHEAEAIVAEIQAEQG
jgi:thiol-disulfide isomerase/thioredoxin